MNYRIEITYRTWDSGATTFVENVDAPSYTDAYNQVAGKVKKFRRLMCIESGRCIGQPIEVAKAH